MEVVRKRFKSLGKELIFFPYDPSDAKKKQKPPKTEHTLSTQPKKCKNDDDCSRGHYCKVLANEKICGTLYLETDLRNTRPFFIAEVHFEPNSASVGGMV